MASRGIWHFMSARTRRSLTLSWTALFVCSLLLQYFSFAAAAPVLAVHDEGLFELDGNATTSAASPATTGTRPQRHLGSAFIPSRSRRTPRTSPTSRAAARRTTTTSASGVLGERTSLPTRTTSRRLRRRPTRTAATTFVYFGLDRFDDYGDAKVGFWFLQDTIALGAGGAFTGTTPSATS